jgi:hypothetical protein
MKELNSSEIYASLASFNDDGKSELNVQQSINNFVKAFINWGETEFKVDTAITAAVNKVMNKLGSLPISQKDLVDFSTAFYAKDTGETSVEVLSDIKKRIISYIKSNSFCNLEEPTKKFWARDKVGVVVWSSKTERDYRKLQESNA